MLSNSINKTKEFAEPGANAQNLSGPGHYGGGKAVTRAAAEYIRQIKTAYFCVIVILLWTLN